MTKHNQPSEITQCTVCGNGIPVTYTFEAWCAECSQGFNGNEVTTLGDPITEEALREKGFTKDRSGSFVKVISSPFDSMEIEVDFFTGTYIDLSINKGKNGSFFRVQGCKTLQDIETLIRLLGGAE